MREQPQTDACAAIELRLIVDATPPPSGRLLIALAGESEPRVVLFEGWSGLIHALDHALGGSRADERT